MSKTEAITTNKRMFSKNDRQFLINLANTMNTQENDGQAAPRFWVVACDQKVYKGEDYCDNMALCSDDGEIIENATFESVLDYFKKQYKDEIEAEDITFETKETHVVAHYNTYLLDDEESLFSCNDIIEYFESHDIIENDHYTINYYCIEQHVIEPNTLFLTKEACQEHIKLNHYNYNNPHTYAMTAYRSPEISRLYDIIENIDWETMVNHVVIRKVKI